MHAEEDSSSSSSPAWRDVKFPWTNTSLSVLDRFVMASVHAKDTVFTLPTGCSLPLWSMEASYNWKLPAAKTNRINAMALQKWRAWKSHGQLSSSVAMMEYIRFATEVTLRLRANQGKRSEKNGDSDASDGQLPLKHQSHTPQLAPLKDARQTASDGPHDGGSSSGMISPIRLQSSTVSSRISVMPATLHPSTFEV